MTVEAIHKERAIGDLPPASSPLTAEEQIEAARNERMRAIEHLSEPRMLAIMQMSEMLRHQTIWHAERQRFSVPPFTLSDFIALRDDGLAEKPAGRSFHVLTAKGRMAADAVADYLVRAHSIHAPYLRRDGASTARVRCTCGWSSVFRNWGDVQRKANNAFLEHLRTVTAINDMATALVPRHVGETE